VAILARKGLKVFLAIQASTEHMDTMAFREPLDSKVHLGFLVLWVVTV